MFARKGSFFIRRSVHSLVLGRPAEAGTHEIQTLTALRSKMKQLVGAPMEFGEILPNRADLSHLLTKSQTALPTRRLFDSYDEAIIPLRENLVVREEYYNAFRRVRFGRLLEDLDMFAVWLTYKHTSYSGLENTISPLAIVTGMVDRIDIENKLMPTDRNIRLRGLVTWVGESSAETFLVMEQEKADYDLNSGEWEKILEARFVLVARDPKNNRKAFLNPLKPDGPEEEALHKVALDHQARRQQWSADSLFKFPPTPEESRLIHEKFLATVDPKESVYSVRTKPQNSVWLDDAKLKNVHICHPQNRNIYGKVFGGFLMRNAFELAWSNAYLHSGSRPIILTVDDIKFRRPVEIGSLLLMSSRLVYTDGPDMQMRVHAEVINPLTEKRETTNTFYFTFRDFANKPVKSVIPKTYADAMLYLTGRRHYAASKHYRRILEYEAAHSADLDKKSKC